jgi:hypothetical protein
MFCVSLTQYFMLTEKKKGQHADFRVSILDAGCQRRAPHEQGHYRKSEKQPFPPAEGIDALDSW